MASRDMSRTRSAPVDPDAAGGDTDAEMTSSRAKRSSAARSGGGGGGGARSSGNSGWAGYKAAKASASKWNSKDEFKISELDERYYGKFLDDGPFFFYGLHFYKGRPDKQAFTCIEDCPLCGIGETPTVYACFNVLDLNGAEPAVKYWRCTPSPAGQIEEFEEEGPINADDRYFVAFKKKGKGEFNEFFVKEILDVKLKDKAGVDPFSEEELTAFAEQGYSEEDMYDRKVVTRSTRSELQQVARELLGEED